MIVVDTKSDKRHFQIPAAQNPFLYLTSLESRPNNRSNATLSIRARF